MKKSTLNADLTLRKSMVEIETEPRDTSAKRAKVHSQTRKETTPTS